MKKKGEDPGRDRKKKLILDSGAWSVWSIGAEMDFGKYIKFCLDHEDVVDIFIALDVIPGKKSDNRAPTPKEIEIACEEGYQNYHRMLKAGLSKEKVVPVFHQFDEFKWLKKYMEEGVPYIGLSPRKTGATRGQHQAWLDSCMAYVTDDDGKARTKLHGFGLTSVALMLRYPWHSVDSRSTNFAAKFGKILLPRMIRGEWDFLHTPNSVSVSTRNIDVHEKGAHFFNMSPKAQEIIKGYIKEAGGRLGESEYRPMPLDYKYERGKEVIFKKMRDHLIIERIIKRGVLNSMYDRLRVNTYFFKKVEESVEGIERKFLPKSRKRGLLNSHDAPRIKGGMKPPIIDHLNIFIAGHCGDEGTADASTYHRLHNRLLTFSGMADKIYWEEFEYLVRYRRGLEK